MTAADWPPELRLAPGGPWVVGLDLSLDSTGVAYANGRAACIDASKFRGAERLQFVLDNVREAFDVAESVPDLVAVEGYAYNGGAKAAFVMGELGGLVRLELWRECIPHVIVPPNKLKQYATGKGSGPGTDKTAMVVAARDRLAFGGLSHDQADALWLRAYGLDLLGAPLVALPKAHRAALDGASIVCRPSNEEVAW